MDERHPNLGHEAAGYALMGWPVFPLAPGGKTPLYHSPHQRSDPARRACRGECGKYGHGVLDATTDRGTIHHWWHLHPEANIGIATGLPGPDVVDVDCKAGAPGLFTLKKLLDHTRLLAGSFMCVVTPSGGLHLYYEGTDQANSTRKKDGIDFRGKGGYVAAPPSLVGTTRYQIRETRLGVSGRVDWSAIKQELDPKIDFSRPPRDWSGAGIDGLVDFVLSQAPGNRNSGLHWAACRVAEDGADPAAIQKLIAAGAQVCEGGEFEARRTVLSACRVVAGS